MQSNVIAGNTAALPREDDIRFFEAHGWWISPPILPDDLLDELAYGAERFLAGERDTPLPMRFGTDWDPALGNVVRQGDYVSLQIDDARRAVADPVLPRIAAALAGTESIRLFHDQVVFKPAAGPGSKSTVGWHSDKAYWASCTSHRMLTAWIPLQDTPLEMGPLAFWDGSHKWPFIEELHTFDVDDLPAIERTFEQRDLRPRIAVQPMRKGQVSFHHCRVVHGSYPNRTDRPRLAFAVHYQDHSNAFNVDAIREGRKVGHLNDVLCRRDARGNPDYSDPDICPRLWPA